jgi:hypothetical protein
MPVVKRYEFNVSFLFDYFINRHALQVHIPGTPDTAPAGFFKCAPVWLYVRVKFLNVAWFESLFLTRRRLRERLQKLVRSMSSGPHH